MTSSGRARASGTNVWQVIHLAEIDYSMEEDFSSDWKRFKIAGYACEKLLTNSFQPEIGIITDFSLNVALDGIIACRIAIMDSSSHARRLDEAI